MAVVVAKRSDDVAVDIVDQVSVVVDFDEITVLQVEEEAGPPTVTKEVLVAPDGGFGWVVACACFVISFLSAGYTRAFLAGVLKEFSSSGIGDASWIKAAPTTLPLLLAPLTGMFLERFGHRATVAMGYFLCALAMSVGSFAASVGPATSTLSVFLGLGLALANTATTDLLKKYFTSKRPLIMALNRISGLVGGLASGSWVELLIAAVGFSGTWLVWSGMFIAILFLGLRVSAKPEKHFISQMKEVPVPDTPEVEGDVVQSTSHLVALLDKMGLADVRCIAVVVKLVGILDRFVKAVLGKMGFSFLCNAQFVLVVAICISNGLGNNCFTSSSAKRAKAIELEAEYASLLPIVATCGEVVMTLAYGLLARRSPFPHVGEYSFALVVAAICGGLPHLCGGFWLLVIFAILGGMASAVMKAVPVLVLIENHGVGNLVGTLNVLKMFDGITKILYPNLASLMDDGTVAYFNGGAMGISALLGLAFSWVCLYLKK